MAYEPYSQNPPTQQMAPQHAQGRQQQYPPQYQQPQYQRAQRSIVPPNDITTTGEWVLTLFLMCIPVINLILLFVWAFGSNTAPSKKNWARANLIWLLIGILATILICVIATAMGVPIFDVLNRYYTH